MASQSCSLCSGEVQWDDSANSIVCLECGYLDDSTQTTLVGHAEATGHSNYRHGDIFNALSTPALKAASGRALAGQSSKANRDAANSREMHEYISSILRIANHTSVSERSQHLFDLAMFEGS